MTQEILFPHDTHQVKVEAWPTLSIVQGSAGAAATYIDLGGAGRCFTLVGAEDFYWLPVSANDGTTPVAANTGMLQPAMQVSKPQFSGSANRYVAIIRSAVTGKVVAQVHGKTAA